MANTMVWVLKLNNGDDVADVPVEVFWPEQREQSWFSDWRIGWPDRERRGSAGGSDAIQALLCALTIVGAELNCSNEYDSRQLSWSDDWAGLGFPVPNGSRDLLVGDDAKYLQRQVSIRQRHSRRRYRHL